MALSKQNQEELPFPIDGIEEEPTVKQVTFDDLEFEAEVVDEEDLAPKKFYTISGKEQQYEPDWEKMKMSELDVGDEFEGRPEITHFVNKDKKSDSLRVRVMDDGEILDCYVNIPKPDQLGYIENINTGFDFYRTCFDFIWSVLKYRDERNVVNKDGEAVNKFSKVNILTFAKYVDSMERIGVRVTEGNASSEYNSFIIYKME